MKKIISIIILSTLGLTSAFAQSYFFEIEPNDAASIANTVKMTDSVIETMSPAGDVDYFMFDIPSNGTLTFTLGNIGVNQAIQLTVYDSALTQVSTASSLGLGLKFTHSFAVKAGKIYIKINDVNNVEYTTFFGFFLALNTSTNGIQAIDTSGTNLSVYPNPISKQLTLTTTNHEKITVVLCNSLGQNLLQQTFANSTTINTEPLADGIYFYELHNDKGVLKTGKIVKE